ncbi:hypothetical protein [Methanobrevibacter arboriphilus]|nr:hypothetical protein [Methanobrevibacter arboriphilus]
MIRVLQYIPYPKKYKGDEKIRKQTIAKEDNFNSIKEYNKAKIMVPLLLLTLILLFSCIVTDVQAAQETSNNTVVQSNNSIVSNTELEDSQTTAKNTSKTSNNSNETSNSLNSKSNQTLKDPQIYKDGVPVARGGNPPGYIYSTIADAISVALSGDTIMLENGATFF